MTTYRFDLTHGGLLGPHAEHAVGVDVTAGRTEPDIRHPNNEK
jgi:hypothetical protein